MIVERDSALPLTRSKIGASFHENAIIGSTAAAMRRRKYCVRLKFEVRSVSLSAVHGRSACTIVERANGYLVGCIKRLIAVNLTAG